MERGAKNSSIVSTSHRLPQLLFLPLKFCGKRLGKISFCLRPPTMMRSSRRMYIDGPSKNSSPKDIPRSARCPVVIVRYFWKKGTKHSLNGRSPNNVWRADDYDVFVER